MTYKNRIDGKKAVQILKNLVGKDYIIERLKGGNFLPFGCTKHEFSFSEEDNEKWIEGRFGTEIERLKQKISTLKKKQSKSADDELELEKKEKRLKLIEGIIEKDRIAYKYFKEKFANSFIYKKIGELVDLLERESDEDNILRYNEQICSLLCFIKDPLYIKILIKCGSNGALEKSIVDRLLGVNLVDGNVGYGGFKLKKDEIDFIKALSSESFEDKLNFIIPFGCYNLDSVNSVGYYKEKLSTLFIDEIEPALEEIILRLDNGTTESVEYNDKIYNGLNNFFNNTEHKNGVNVDSGTLSFNRNGTLKVYNVANQDNDTSIIFGLEDLEEKSLPLKDLSEDTIKLLELEFESIINKRNVLEDFKKSVYDFNEKLYDAIYLYNNRKENEKCLGLDFYVRIALGLESGQKLETEVKNRIEEENKKKEDKLRELNKLRTYVTTFVNKVEGNSKIVFNSDKKCEVPNPTTKNKSNKTLVHSSNLNTYYNLYKDDNTEDYRSFCTSILEAYKIVKDIYGNDEEIDEGRLLTQDLDNLKKQTQALENNLICAECIVEAIEEEVENIQKPVNLSDNKFKSVLRNVTANCTNSIITGNPNKVEDINLKDSLGLQNGGEEEKAVKTLISDALTYRKGDLEQKFFKDIYDKKEPELEDYNKHPLNSLPQEYDKKVNVACNIANMLLELKQNKDYNSLNKDALEGARSNIINLMNLEDLEGSLFDENTIKSKVKGIVKEVQKKYEIKKIKEYLKPFDKLFNVLDNDGQQVSLRGNIKDVGDNKSGKVELPIFSIVTDEISESRTVYLNDLKYIKDKGEQKYKNEFDSVRNGSVLNILQGIKNKIANNGAGYEVGKLEDIKRKLSSATNGLKTIQDEVNGVWADTDNVYKTLVGDDIFRDNTLAANQTLTTTEEVIHSTKEITGNTINVDDLEDENVKIEDSGSIKKAKDVITNDIKNIKGARETRNLENYRDYVAQLNEHIKLAILTKEKLGLNPELDSANNTYSAIAIDAITNFNIRTDYSKSTNSINWKGDGKFKVGTKDLSLTALNDEEKKIIEAELKAVSQCAVETNDMYNRYTDPKNIDLPQIYGTIESYSKKVVSLKNHIFRRIELQSKSNFSKLTYPKAKEAATEAIFKDNKTADEAFEIGLKWQNKSEAIDETKKAVRLFVGKNNTNGGFYKIDLSKADGQVTLINNIVSNDKSDTLLDANVGKNADNIKNNLKKIDGKDNSAKEVAKAYAQIAIDLLIKLKEKLRLVIPVDAINKSDIDNLNQATAEVNAIANFIQSCINGRLVDQTAITAIGEVLKGKNISDSLKEGSTIKNTVDSIITGGLSKSNGERALDSLGKITIDDGSLKAVIDAKKGELNTEKNNLSTAIQNKNKTNIDNEKVNVDKLAGEADNLVVLSEQTGTNKNYIDKLSGENIKTVIKEETNFEKDETSDKKVLSGLGVERIKGMVERANLGEKLGKTIKANSVAQNKDLAEVDLGSNKSDAVLKPEGVGKLKNGLVGNFNNIPTTLTEHNKVAANPNSTSAQLIESNGKVKNINDNIRGLLLLSEEQLGKIANLVDKQNLEKSYTPGSEIYDKVIELIGKKESAKQKRDGIDGGICAMEGEAVKNLEPKNLKEITNPTSDLVSNNSFKTIEGKDNKGKDIEDGKVVPVNTLNSGKYNKTRGILIEAHNNLADKRTDTKISDANIKDVSDLEDLEKAQKELNATIYVIAQCLGKNYSDDDIEKVFGKIKVADNEIDTNKLEEALKLVDAQKKLANNLKTILKDDKITDNGDISFGTKKEDSDLTSGDKTSGKALTDTELGNLITFVNNKTPEGNKARTELGGAIEKVRGVLNKKDATPEEIEKANEQAENLKGRLKKFAQLTPEQQNEVANGDAFNQTNLLDTKGDNPLDEKMKTAETETEQKLQEADSRLEAMLGGNNTPAVKGLKLGETTAIDDSNINPDGSFIALDENYNPVGGGSLPVKELLRLDGVNTEQGKSNVKIEFLSLYNLLLSSRKRIEEQKNSDDYASKVYDFYRLIEIYREIIRKQIKILTDKNLTDQQKIDALKKMRKGFNLDPEDVINEQIKESAGAAIGLFTDKLNNDGYTDNNGNKTELNATNIEDAVENGIKGEEDKIVGKAVKNGIAIEEERKKQIAKTLVETQKLIAKEKPDENEKSKIVENTRILKNECAVLEKAMGKKNKGEPLTKEQTEDVLKKAVEAGKKGEEFDVENAINSVINVNEWTAKLTPEEKAKVEEISSKFNSLMNNLSTEYQFLGAIGTKNDNNLSYAKANALRNIEILVNNFIKLTNPKDFSDFKILIHWIENYKNKFNNSEIADLSEKLNLISGEINGLHKCKKKYIDTYTEVQERFRTQIGGLLNDIAKIDAINKTEKFINENIKKDPRQFNKELKDETDRNKHLLKVIQYDTFIDSRKAKVGNFELSSEFDKNLNEGIDERTAECVRKIESNISYLSDGRADTNNNKILIKEDGIISFVDNLDEFSKLTEIHNSKKKEEVNNLGKICEVAITAEKIKISAKENKTHNGALNDKTKGSEFFEEAIKNPNSIYFEEFELKNNCLTIQRKNSKDKLVLKNLGSGIPYLEIASKWIGKNFGLTAFICAVYEWKYIKEGKDLPVKDIASDISVIVDGKELNLGESLKRVDSGTANEDDNVVISSFTNSIRAEQPNKYIVHEEDKFKINSIFSTEKQLSAFIQSCNSNNDEQVVKGIADSGVLKKTLNLYSLEQNLYGVNCKIKPYHKELDDQVGEGPVRL